MKENGSTINEYTKDRQPKSDPLKKESSFEGWGMEVDILIIGGGVAGACTAIHLSSLIPSISVLMVDARTDGTFKIGESLPANAKPLLNMMKVAGQIESDTKLGNTPLIYYYYYSL